MTPLPEIAGSDGEPALGLDLRFDDGYRVTEVIARQQRSRLRWLFATTVRGQWTEEEEAMAKPRRTYKYQFKIGNKIVHGGITNDLERREQEHKREWPNGHIRQVGRRTTAEGGRQWESDNGYA